MDGARSRAVAASPGGVPAEKVGDIIVDGTMPGFAERLRRTRESHDISIEEMAAATGVDLRYLEALERGDFDGLPGRAFGKLYVRAYAEHCGFDPTGLIELYDAELVERTPTEREIPQVEAPQHAWKTTLHDVRRQAREARLASLDAAEEASEFTESEEVAQPVELDQAAQPVEPEEPATVVEPEVVATPVEVAVPGPSIEAPPSAAPPLPRRRVALFVLAASVAMLLVIVAVSAFVDTDEATALPEEREPVIRQAAPSPSPEETTAAEMPAKAPAVIAQPRPAGRLSVSEFGVGRRIVDLRLQGTDDRFEEGGTVWFSTRVLGGSGGERIRHLWFREGGRVQEVELEIGGGHWRTHSKKTLWGQGNWSVEARDADDRVLARTTFTCVPADS